MIERVLESYFWVGQETPPPRELKMTYEISWRKGKQRHLEFHLLELLVEEGSKETSLISYLEDFQLVTWEENMLQM
jgi:hypothetical protein